MNRKGIVLAGGSGTRLHPITRAVSKQLLPVYDKPMVFYPISTLMLAGIKQILIISTPDDMVNYKSLLGDGSRFGVSFEYAIQEQPDGLASAFIIGESFIGDDSVCLILGDNLFHGQGLHASLIDAMNRQDGATIFGYQVKDPERFGVVEFDRKKRVISLEEKPLMPKSKYAVTGLYFYDNSVIETAKNIKRSPRGEFEITDINKFYLKNRTLHFEEFGRGFVWLDMGTHDSLLEAGSFIQTVEHRQGLKVACLEEIACRNGWISVDKMVELGEEMKSTEYGKYLIEIGSEIKEAATERMT
jgi:glucose-1-phosphate thymidylyltransferase